MKSYSIVFTSATGNTARLAERLRAVLPGPGPVYFGPPDEKGADAGLIFAGFWTDKGGCGGEISAFLEGLRGKEVFLFGTAGFGGSDAYFEKILCGVRAHLDESNAVAGAFMCQGQMPEAVRQRYEAMRGQDPEKAGALIENFDRARTHPDDEDLRALERAAEPLLD